MPTEEFTTEAIYGSINTPSTKLGQGFPGGSVGKETACHVGDPGSIPGLGRSPGEGHGSPLRHSCLENPMDRGAWWAVVRGMESRTRLSIGHMQESAWCVPGAVSVSFPSYRHWVTSLQLA